MILALDTVFDQCSVAFVSLQGEVIDEQTLTGNRQQTQQILPLIKTVMDEAQITFTDLTAIAFNRGPGAFSGIRINTAVAQALAFAHDLPCLPVSSLQAVAQQAYLDEGLGHVLASIDARMNQVYMGEFHVHTTDSIMLPTWEGTEQLINYHSLIDEDLMIVVGQTPELALPQKHANHAWQTNAPTASIIGQIGAYDFTQGKAVTAENALPVYLRHNAWKTLAEQGKK